MRFLKTLMLFTVTILVAVLILIKLPHSGTDRSDSPADLNADRAVLFVGNSFTFGFDVPAQVQRIAASATPEIRYDVKSIARPSYRLSEHWEDGDVQRELTSGRWQVVVLQDASNTAFSPAARRQFEEVSAQYSALASANGVDIVWFAHWRPDLNNSMSEQQRHSEILAFYQTAATRSGGKVARVASRFDAAARAGIHGLLSSDDHHASLSGAHLAALEIVATLDDVDMTTVDWHPEALDQPLAEKLRRIVMTGTR